MGNFLGVHPSLRLDIGLLKANVYLTEEIFSITLFVRQRRLRSKSLRITSLLFCESNHTNTATVCTSQTHITGALATSLSVLQPILRTWDSFHMTNAT